MRTARLHKIERAGQFVPQDTVLDRGELLKMTDDDFFIIGDGSTAVAELPVYTGDDQESNGGD